MVGFVYPSAITVQHPSAVEPHHQLVIRPRVTLKAPTGLSKVWSCGFPEDATAENVVVPSIDVPA